MTSADFRSSLTKTLAEDIDSPAAIFRQAHFLAADRWDKYNTGLGLAAVLIGVVGGVLAGVVLRSETLNLNLSVASACATITGLLSAVISFLKPADRVAEHKRASDDWSNLQDQADGLRLKMMVANVQDSVLQEDCASLLKKKAETMDSNRIPPSWALDTAKKTLLATH